ncbi:MAG TPA: hypothetical protein VKB80_19390 [Kofleriaceae bacterium]|nr:hypothetical protein [Kofleriaceae bacterium]
MESLFGGAFVGAFALLVGLEGLRPARRLPAVRLWRASSHVGEVGDAGRAPPR